MVFAILANDYRRGRHAADRGIEDVCESFLVLGAPDGADAAMPARDILGGPSSASSADIGAEPSAVPVVVGPDGISEGEDPGDEDGD